jgi:hypothetical protein
MARWTELLVRALAVGIDDAEPDAEAEAEAGGRGAGQGLGGVPFALRDVSDSGSDAAPRISISESPEPRFRDQPTALSALLSAAAVENGRRAALGLDGGGPPIDFQGFRFP